jgi:hypothetical protein
MSLLALVILIFVASATAILAGEPQAHVVEDDLVQRDIDVDCSLLDDQSMRPLMSGMFVSRTSTARRGCAGQRFEHRFRSLAHAK